METTYKRLLTVAMPVFNEGSTIRGAVESLLKVDFPVEIELLVVDDGSTDGSIDLIEDLEDDITVRVLRHKDNRGKGAALRTALDHAQGDVFTILDADLESDPADLKLLLEAILLENVTAVYGKRSFGAHNAYSFWYVVGNHFLGFVTSFLFNTWISDIETCFKMAETEVWRSLRPRSNGFGIEAEITAKLLRSGHIIHEVPISYRPRSRKQGKKIKWSDGLAALAILIGIRVLPMKFWKAR